MNATDYYKERANYNMQVEEFKKLVEKHCPFLVDDEMNWWYNCKIEPNTGIIDYSMLSDICIFTNVKIFKGTLYTCDLHGSICTNWCDSVHVNIKNKNKIIQCLENLNLSYKKALEDYKIEKIEKDFK